MQNDLEHVPEPLTPDATPSQAPTPAEGQGWKEFRKKIDACKQYRRKLIPLWVANIDYRRGKPFASQTDEDRVVVNLDWSLTKAKQAALFSQVPQVRIDHFPETLSLPWLETLEQRINDTIVVAGIETVMDECLPDVINAAGIAAALVAHEVLTTTKKIPKTDLSSLPPQIHSQVLQSGMMPDGSPVEMIEVPSVADHRYTVTRISPSDLLWPINFTGADFDNAPWLGRTGRVTWAQAQQIFGLTEEDKDKVMGESKGYLDKLTHDLDKEKMGFNDYVEFDEIFYKEYQFDATSTSYDKIHHLIFVTGKDEPVKDEPWNGQDMSEGDVPVLIGSLKYPIRALTLTYITDETIPPSDSAIGRPQVNEINKGRTQNILQRERSLPIRWFNTDRMDPLIQQSLMRGTWQTMIPVQGDGARVVGEVARASMPVENGTFDAIAKSDLVEAWQIGPNQQGNFGSGRQSATEANVVESNFQTRIGRERAKVAKFFVSIAEVLGGLIALYEPPESLGQGFDPAISRTLGYSILADSTVLIDSQQKVKRIQEFIDFTAKSGFLNIEPVLREYASISGFDPSVTIRAPEPKPPVEPNISLRLSGAEDLSNPLILAFMMQSGQAPKPELIEQAKKLLLLAQGPALHPEGHPQNPGSAPGGPPPPEGGEAPPDGVIPPPPGPPEVGAANPKWAMMNTISKRSDGQEK